MRRTAMLIVTLSVLAIAPGAARADNGSCPAGSFSIDGNEPCTPCDAGTFAANPGSTFCEPCAVGKFTSDVGSASCQDCSLGSYAAQPGTIACTPCEPGRYSDIYGATACASCPPGYFSDQEGQSACLLCSAGSFAAEPGSSACQPCSAGRYSEVLGATECTECSPGTFSADVGANSSQACTPCPAGRYAASSGAAACSDCPRNAYAPESGLTQCLACGCDDAIACTRDACDAVAGTCSAPVVADCQPIEVAFSGTVSLVDPLLFSTAPIGSPVEGRFSYDPEAPDATPLDPRLGDYPSAVTAFEVAIGVGPSIVATSPGGSVHVEDDILGWDLIDFEASAADGLDGPVLAALPDGVRESYRLRLADSGGTAHASDALPAAGPDFARFPIRSASLEIHSPSAAGNVYVDAYGVVDAPEPHAALAAATALACLLALARRTGRNGARSRPC